MKKLPDGVALSFHFLFETGDGSGLVYEVKRAYAREYSQELDEALAKMQEEAKAEIEKATGKPVKPTTEKDLMAFTHFMASAERHFSRLINEAVFAEQQALVANSVGEA